MVFNFLAFDSGNVVLFNFLLDTSSQKILDTSCSVKKFFLKNLQNSQENTCSRVSFLVKLQALLKKRLWHRCFSVTFAKVLETPFCIEYLWWLFCLVFNFCNQPLYQMLWWTGKRSIICFFDSMSSAK